jgi:hypothetical protein
MRYCLCALVLSLGALFAAVPPPEILRGKLTIHEGRPASLETADHKTVLLDGDETTSSVLTDSRLDGFDVQARGHFTSPGHFLIDPSHTHSLLVRKDGHLKLITYFCGLCNIRAYTPGPCVCCQQETTLDLVDEDKN